MIVLTDQALRQILQKHDMSGRLVKWAVELSEFDIQYKPKPTIKSQVLADFIIECIVLDDIPDVQPQSPSNDTSLSIRPYILHVDGPSISSASGAGIILTNPEGGTIECALRFIFPTSNYEAKYEALIIGLKLAAKLKVSELRVFSDSQLVIKQIRGELEAHNSSMARYLTKAKELTAQFSKCDLQHISRSKNAQADRLSKLATSQIEDLDPHVYIETIEARGTKEPKSAL